MKTISITMTECVGPLCSRKGIRISTSGTMESTNVAGMLKLVLESFADPPPRIYPRARCPTAKRLLFLRFKHERCFIWLLSLLASGIIGNVKCSPADPMVLVWQNCRRYIYFLRIEGSSMALAVTHELAMALRAG